MSLGSRCAHLAGLGIHIPAGKEFFHHAHVLLRFHGGEGGQHDGGVPRLVLVVHVTHICEDMSLFREKTSPNMN